MTLTDRLAEALRLAEVWLLNCTPHIEATADRPLPIPVIRAALAEYDRERGREDADAQ